MPGIAFGEQLELPHSNSHRKRGGVLNSMSSSMEQYFHVHIKFLCL